MIASNLANLLQNSFEFEAESWFIFKNKNEEKNPVPCTLYSIYWFVAYKSKILKKKKLFFIDVALFFFLNNSFFPKDS